MTATIDEVVKALTEFNIRTQVVPADGDRVRVNGINVWLGDRLDRYPTTTVYEPADGDGWVWGSNFQWGDHADADAEHVARRIIETGAT